MNRDSLRLALALPVLFGLAACASVRSEPEMIPVECAGTGPVQVYLPGEVTVRPTADAPAFDWKAAAGSVLYPEFARRQQVEGDVTVEVVVDQTGRAVSTALVGDGPAMPSTEGLLVQAAVEGLMSAEYHPAPPRPSGLRVEVSFRLVRPGAG